MQIDYCYNFCANEMNSKRQIKREHLVTWYTFKFDANEFLNIYTFHKH